MTIQITRGTNSFEYRQREQEPNVLEGRATYKGSRWQFLKRYDTPDEARAALLALIAPAASILREPSGREAADREAKWRQENVLARRSSQEVSPPSAGQARFVAGDEEGKP